MIDKLMESVRNENWLDATNTLFAHWSEKVPELYGAIEVEPWDLKFDEDKINRELLAPVAAMYILEEPVVTTGEVVSLKGLTSKIGISETSRRPGQLCGKLFKNGDPTYTCKECAADDTCVLCHECFKQSAHAKHKYRMHSSSGGGYCDCGDDQAWSHDHACKLHTSEPQPGDEELNLSTTVPIEIRTRILNVTGILLKYAVTLVCWQDTLKLPGFLSEPGDKIPTNAYKTMLFNDETHTYDAVISALEYAVNCTNQQAMYLATIVDREGRSVVASNSKTICQKVQEAIQQRTKRDVNRRTERGGPLEVKVMTASLVAHQALAVRILGWLTDEASRCPPIASIVADALMTECSVLCKHLDTDSKYDVTIPPPKPPRSIHEHPPTPMFSVDGTAVMPLEEPVLDPNGPDDDDDVRFLERRTRHPATVQTPNPVPRLEKKYLANTDNKLPCGHLTPCVQLALFDRRLWKSARVNFHQLLMATVLMDMRHKRDFGVFLIRNYDFIYQDYVDDDHEHNVSIVSLNVQVLTVPSIAHYLISEENALAIVIEALHLHCHKYCRIQEHNPCFVRFDFSARPMPALLRRSLVMFQDALYMLMACSTSWTPGLQDNFVKAADAYLSFVTVMQGMDSIKRQLDQHQLIESEWETAFTLQVTMQETTAMLLAWARTDAYVHQRFTKLVFDRICEIQSCCIEFQQEIEVAIDEFAVTSVPFNVSKDFVSVHQPVWRLLAGLLVAPPEIAKTYRFGMKDSHAPPKTVNIASPIAELEAAGWKERRAIEGLYVWNLTGFLEAPMRVLVLQAQCNASLWRRNGFSLVNQIHNYTAPICRSQMFDRDLQLLQVCAAQLPPLQFLIRFLHRFGLDKWAATGFEELPLKTSTDGTPVTPSQTLEDLSKTVVALSEEFLQIMIYIFMERYVHGIGKCTRAEALEREVVHLLCTGPTTFSSIEKTFKRILEPNLKSIELEAAVQRVADFRKPTTTAPGSFSLKASRRASYNPFFYHYSRQQFSQAEQAQWREREKEPREIQACPPPKSPPFEAFFEPILKLLETPLFVRLLDHVLVIVSKRSRYMSEGLLHRTLFLLGIGLNEQLAAIEVGKPFDFALQCEAAGLLTTLKKIEGTPQAETHKQLLWWVLQRFEEVQSKTTKRDVIDEARPTDATNASADSALSAKEKAEKRAALAAKRREQAMRKMQKMQQAFSTMNKEALNATEEDDSMNGNDYDDEIEYSTLDEAEFPVCLGEHRSKVTYHSSRSITCILCQEVEQLSFSGKQVVCAGYLHNSKLFTQTDTSAADVLGFDDPTDVFAPSDMSQGYSISTCSHTMHLDCFKMFSTTLWARDRTRPRMHIMGQQIIDQDNHEFLCPLCKRLSNCTLPLLPSLNNLVAVRRFSSIPRAGEDNRSVETFNDWFNRVSELANNAAKPTQESTVSAFARHHKTHSRKRSHSERSLLDLQKHDSEVSLHSSHSSSQPSVVPLSPAGAPRGASEPATVAPIANEAPADPAVLNAAHRTANSSINHVNDQTGLFTKLKTFIPGNRKTDNIPAGFTVWPVMKPFFEYVYQLGPDFGTTSGRAHAEVFRVYKTTAFFLRQVTSILRDEQKPLFGALNTRQRDCLQCMTRIAAVAAFHLKQSTIRFGALRILAMLLVSPSDRESKHSALHSSTLGIDSIKNFVLRPFLGNTSNLHRNLTSTDANPLGSSSSSLAGNTSMSSSSTSTMTSSDLLITEVYSDMNIMHVDMLELTIHLTMTIGWLDNSQTNTPSPLKPGTPVADEPAQRLPDGSTDEQHSIYLTLLGYLFQCMATFRVADDEDVEMVDADEVDPPCGADGGTLSDRIKELLNIMQKPTSEMEKTYANINVRALERHLRTSVVDFLQPLALFYHCLTLIPAPDSLKHTGYNEFESLCRYLGLPSRLEDLLGPKCVLSFWEAWTEHLVPIQHKLERLPRFPPVPRRLIELPHEFTDLLTLCSSFKCPSLNVSDLATSQPTMCLVCGQIMCSQSYCCQRTLENENLGACNYHMRQCTGVSGMFLRIRDCQIVMLTSRKRGTFRPAPYVDQFGETDLGFRRCNPLFLHEDMYRRLQRIWLHQEMAEEIVNQYDINHRNSNYEWHHF
uniref:E3 ubiquitin-protein ligase n=1 Tax=Panagrellus redivivus TaxID=6233 RepID=A0A7E4W1J9_PANRE